MRHRLTLLAVAVLSLALVTGGSDGASYASSPSRGLLAAAAPDTLNAGRQLTPGQRLSSPLDRFHLLMQSDGNAVLIGPTGRALWSTGTAGAPGARLVMQHDGNVVVYDGDDRPLWASGTQGNPGSRLVMQYDGNLVIYAPDNSPLWFTGVPSGDTMTPGQHLTNNQALVAFGGAYFLRAQTDGNVVLYAQRSHGLQALWHTGTHGNPGAYLVLQRDGNLVVYGTGGRALWASRTQGLAAARLLVQWDGNLVLYRADGKALWATGKDPALP